MMRNIFGTASLTAVLLAFSQADLGAQHLHYSTLSGYCEDAEDNAPECCQAEPSHGNCPRKEFHWWERDDIAEEDYETSGWPGRRDELSDILSR